MLPLTLTLQNYCQHNNLTLDFTKGKVIAIVGDNGRGKSNIFYALRFALTGESTPGAKRLEDDILDGTDKAIVTLCFSITEEFQGTIKRTLNRKGANSVELRLVNKGIIETIVKSAEAERRFTELLGYNPKDLSGIIIAEQRQIEQLLFDKGAKRLERWQTFFQGGLFQERYAQVKNLSDRVFINIAAADQVKTFEAQLESTKKILGEIDADIALIKHKFKLEDIQAWKEKAKLVNQFKEIKENYANCLKNISDQLVQLENLKQNTTIAGEISQKLNALEVQITSIRNEIERHTTYTNQIATLTSAITDISDIENEYLKLVDDHKHWQVLHQQLNDVLVAWNNTRFYNNRRILQQEIEEKSREILQLKEKQLNVTATNIALVREIGALEKILELLKHSSGTQCPVCTQHIPKDFNPTVRIAELKTFIDAKTQSTIMYSIEEKRLNDELLKLERLISAKQREYQLIPITQPSGDLIELTNTKQTLEKEISLYRDLSKEVEICYKKLSGKLAQQLALEELKKSSITCNHSSKDLEALQLQISTYRVLLSECTERDNSIVRVMATIAAERNNLTLWEKKALQLKLPPLNTNFDLTDKERTTLLDYTQNYESRLLTLQTNHTKYTAIKEQLDKTIQELKIQELGASDGEGLKDYLGKLGDYYKEMPQLLLKQQLQQLCSKVDQIVQQFSIAQPFSLFLDENLEFYFRYPSGKTRPIIKASGGERIILGLAFRLASHKIMAPELPILAIDEPTNYLSQQNIRALTELIKYLTTHLSEFQLQQVLISTHSTELAKEADYTFVL